MIKVRVLDESGHTELEVASLEELKEKVDLKDKFMFFDGKYQNEVSIGGITELPREITITDRLIGG